MGEKGGRKRKEMGREASEHGQCVEQRGDETNDLREGLKQPSDIKASREKS